MRATVDPHDCVLQVEGLRKRYGATEALGGVSFEVPRGSFFGFFGRNGAGKTTTLDIITGLLGRDEGLVTLFGEAVGLEPSVTAKQRLAYVGGHLLLYDWMTLQEHLDYVSGFYPTWDAARCAELQEVFVLPLQSSVGSLSPGQHLQFQLLLALSRRPELLLIDEPGNLDVVVRADLMDSLIRLLHDGDSTIVMASHLINELEGVCDYLCVVDRGLTVACGAVSDLVADVREVHYEGAQARPAEALAGVWHRQLGPGELRVLMLGYTERRAQELSEQLQARTHEVSPVTLEEFFMALTTERQ